MENFSTTCSEDNLTGRDHLIYEMISKTGLNEKIVNRLFEDFSVVNDGSLEKINESFMSFLNPNKLDFKTFYKMFVDKCRIGAKAVLSELDKHNIVIELIEVIRPLAENEKVDAITLMKIITSVLLLKDKNKFEKLVSEIDLAKDVKYEVAGFNESETIPLMESFDLGENQLKETLIKNSKHTVKLYEGLRDILTKNNIEWGYSHHLADSHAAIMNYIDEEITEITNDANIYSIDDNFHDTLINQLITGEINPMYRNVDVLRGLIPDLQTLVFNCLVLTTTFVTDNQYIFENLSRPQYIKFLNATKTFYSRISSSKKRSILLRDKVKNHKLSDVAEPNQGILDELQMDWTKTPYHNCRLNFKNVIDCLYIIKSCSGEFNLSIRQNLNYYVTQAFNILASGEKIYYKQNSLTI